MRALLLLILIPSLAHAEGACAPYPALLKGLAEHSGEQPIAHALADGGTVLTVTTNADGSTYSLLATRPDGLTCFLGTGHSWESVTPKPPGDLT